jgi:hypothetical protein
MLQKIKKVVIGVVALGMVGAGSAHAALDWTGVTLGTADVSSVMALIVVGLAVLWGYRKVVKTMNRS